MVVFPLAIVLTKRKEHLIPHFFYSRSMEQDGVVKPYPNSKPRSISRKPTPMYPFNKGGPKEKKKEQLSSLA